MSTSIRILEAHFERLSRRRLTPRYTPDVRGRRDDYEGDGLLVVGGPGPVDVSSALVGVRLPDGTTTPAAGAADPTG